MAEDEFVSNSATSSYDLFNVSGNGSSAFTWNDTDEVDLMTDILWDFYNNFNGQTNYLLIVLYVPMMALAVTANVLVIAVVFKYRSMRSVTNYFVVNLSVADLLVTTICMPVAVSQAISILWIHGEVMCKLSSYLQGVAVAASVFTITAMSIDRYLAIRSPIAFRRFFNRRSTVLVIVALWIVALSIFAPVLRGRTIQSPGMELENITFRGAWGPKGNSTRDILQHSRMPPAFYICSEDFRPLGIRAHLFGVACFVLVYAIPGFVVILTYSMMGRTLCARIPPFDCDSVEGSASSQQSFKLVRERRRIAWILLLLAVLFALCWLPYNVLRLLIDVEAIDDGSVTNILSYCLFLGHANSALNPVVYCFMTRNFRQSVSKILRRALRGLLRRKPRRKSIQGTAIVEDVCEGCSAPGTAATRRGLLRQRKMLPGCGCGIPMRKHHAVLARRQTATSSSGYDSFYSRHSPHCRCYMLKSLRNVPQPPAAVAVAIAGQAKKVQGEDEQLRASYAKNKDNAHSQRRPSTLVTTDERNSAQL